MTHKLLATAVVLMLGGVPVEAAISLQPGEWQSTETGTENGKPAKAEVEKSCMTAEEARDATNVVKEMRKQMQGEGAQCEKFDVQQNGDVVTFTMKCGMGQQFLIDMSGTFTFVSATRYTGTLKSAVKIGATAMTSDKKIEAIRIGECKAGARK